MSAQELYHSGRLIAYSLQSFTKLFLLKLITQKYLNKTTLISTPARTNYKISADLLSKMAGF